jgi:hypothetical protein
MEDLATSASVAPPAGDGEFWAELQHLVDARVVADYEWYRDHASSPRILFRSAGALVATRELLEQARAATGAETEEFFSRVAWPPPDRR